MRFGAVWRAVRTSTLSAFARAAEKAASAAPAAAPKQSAAATTVAGGGSLSKRKQFRMVAPPSVPANARAGRTSYFNQPFAP